MKAITFNQYGSPDVLKLKEVEKPAPKDHEVLVKVHAASLNAADWHILRGTPFLARIEFGLLKPKFNILGGDMAGTVEAVGKKVTHFKVGDAVFGDTLTASLGAFAEYVCASEKTIAIKPQNISFEEAATVPVSAITALQSLKHTGKVKAGQKVLVNGASGGVGTFTVQIAKYFGAEVTAVSSTQKLDISLSLGADHVIDYTKEDFTKNGLLYDLIIDNVGNYSIFDLKSSLNPYGKGVIVGFTSLRLLFQAMFLGTLVSMSGTKKVGLSGTANVNQKDLDFLSQMLETGKVKPVIDRSYSLEEVPQAMHYLEEGHASGKIVIKIQ
jgi:NADPH:quinone reductase-like Zn-dependent oxidoreductase